MSKPCNIVITGMGHVTALGITDSVVLQRIRNGESGIVPVVLDDVLPLLMGRVREEDFPRTEADMTARYALHAGQRAWDQAGLTAADYDPWRVATIVGSSKGRLANLLAGGHVHFDPEDFPGDTLGLALARRMGLAGPILNYPAACATGIVCMIRAAQMLQDDEADVVIAGSGEASGKAVVMASFHNMGALSTQPMRPFHTERTGFNPGEGAAVFVLEREDDALRRGAHILAWLRGWDQRADAYHITSANPDGATVVESIRRALGRASWQPEAIEYINAHGTGTHLNDLVESRAICAAFGQNGPLVSSLKPYVGHLLGASSAVEIALAMLALGHGYVPGTLGLNQPDPNICLNFVPEGGLSQNRRRFMKLSLGFGGHIGVVAIELNEKAFLPR